VKARKAQEHGFAAATNLNKEALNSSRPMGMRLASANNESSPWLNTTIAKILEQEGRDGKDASHRL
jgi:hypothetical protein